jgi:hypothetical protein
MRDTKTPVLRYKSVVVPYVKGSDGLHRYVMFRDSTYKEYTFACGGKKLRETPEECGNRELFEESNGMFDNLVKAGDSCQIFFANDRSKEERRKDHREGIVVTMKYFVYFKEVVDEDYHCLFHSSSEKNSETDDCVSITKEQMRYYKTWKFLFEKINSFLL